MAAILAAIWLCWHDGLRPWPDPGALAGGPARTGRDSVWLRVGAYRARGATAHLAGGTDPVATAANEEVANSK